MDARHFLLNTDYETPVLVYESGQDYWNVGANATRTARLSHGLPFKPLLVGQWALRSDFTPCQDIATDTFYPVFDPIVNYEVVSLYLSADGTNIIFDMNNFSATSSKFYFRLWAYAPPDYGGELPNIYDRTNFMLSTDFNYPKIIKQGVVSVAKNATATITHGLGYIPQVRVWVEKNGAIGPEYARWENGSKGGARVTDQELILRNYNFGGDGGTVKYYYHIYGDES